MSIYAEMNDLVSKSAQTLLNEYQIFFCDFSKLGPKHLKIGKYIEEVSILNR